MTEARLPNPGQDAGVWGAVLNAYLEVAHDDTGALRDGIVTDAKVSSSSPISQAKIAGLATALNSKVEADDFQNLQTQVNSIPSISISATPPSNPSVNDLWVDVS